MSTPSLERFSLAIEPGLVVLGAVGDWIHQHETQHPEIMVRRSIVRRWGSGRMVWLYVEFRELMI
jgi:hypothetical protein